MTKKHAFRSLTKSAKALLVDFAILVAVSDLFLFLFDLIFPVAFGWRHYVALPGYFITFYFILSFATNQYRLMWEHSGSRVFLSLMLNLLIATVATFLLSLATFGTRPITVKWQAFIMFLLFLVSYTALSGVKMLIIIFYVRKHKRKHVEDEPTGDQNNTAIIGAGWTGTGLARLFENDHSIFKPICFIDDNPHKEHRIIEGLPVVGTTHEIDKIVKKYHIHKIIFAIPSCDTEVKKRIVGDCIMTKCELKIVPPLQEMVNKFDQNAISTRDVRIDDLLGREPMVFDMGAIREYIGGRVVLVTGGGGSIGSELCRQIADCKPKKLIILDIYENNAYDIQMELRRHYPDLDLEVVIGSIADYERCRILFDTFRPDYVFHAAAHKHVPLMEHVPEQAVKNNVVGTWNLCELAAEFKVKRFLLISTDKAVNPTNVMGATKRCCEMVVKYHAQTCPDTVFCAVRFGNVLGSNGSVIPLFRRQIEEGGPITITHKDIIRYFMTIPEAVSLVLETGAFSQSGEIFVLDMGKPVKILDLAENMIKLMGLKPYEDIQIKFTGLRPGEKLYEELLISGEDMRKTANQKIFICKQIDVDEKTFRGELNKLISLAKDNKPEKVVEQMHAMIPTYKYPSVTKE